MRIVLDTNVLIRGHARSQSAARRLLEFLVTGGHALVLSNAILAEVTKVLRYPRFQAVYQFTERELYEYIQFLQSVSDSVILDPQYGAPVRDQSDLAILQTAEQGAADVICTNDRDFYDQAVIAYCALRGIEVCDELTLLARLK